MRKGWRTDLVVQKRQQVLSKTLGQEEWGYWRIRRHLCDWCAEWVQQVMTLVRESMLSIYATVEFCKS